MDLRGLDKFSLVDYPGKISCIVFTGGCNLRCPFCHNPCLVFDPTSQPRVTEKEFFGFLAQRKGLLEGVVITGGEPMLHKDLTDFIRRIRESGYLVKLDSNGTFPAELEQLLDSVGVDAMGIDYKAPAARYAAMTGRSEDETIAQRVQRSIRAALAHQLDLDVRTTVHKRLLSADDLRQMYGELGELGVKLWTLQQFNPVEVIDDDLPSEATYSDHELVQIARSLGGNVRVRGLSGRVII